MTNVETGGNTVVINGLMYTILKSSAIIEAESKRGKKFWQAHVVRTPHGVFHTTSSSWQDNGKGPTKVVWSTPYFAEPTNVGRANERDNEAQAYFEFESMVNKQTDKRLSEKPLPMLAQTFRDLIKPKKGREKYIKYPCGVQPKYDGMRVLYDGTTAWSRGNKEVIPEVFAHLHFDTQGCIIDGELILPGNVPVNDTMRAAKKFRAGVSDTLLFRVYDILDETKPFSERIARLEQIVRTNASDNPNIILSVTEIADTVDDVMAFHRRVTEEGFEGTIIRNLDAVYQVNKRTNDLQKFKDFVTEEFEIVDVIEAGGGSSEGVGKFICRAVNGELFESTSTGQLAQRQEYLTNKSAYIGKFAVVKFRELSGAKQVPFHSNVLEVRDTRQGGF